MLKYDAIFINPFPGGAGLNEATILHPLGLAYMAAVLEKNGYQAKIIDANVEGLTTEDVIKRIPPGSSFIGISLNSFSYDSVLEIAKAIKDASPESFIVLGGPLPSASPEMILQEFPCHGIVRGEGELAVLKIVNNINSNTSPLDSQVPGAVFYDNSGQLVMNPLERIHDLDTLPFPAYHLLPPLKKYKVRSRQKPTASIITTRGCAYQCVFCSKDIFQRKVTFRSAENVLEEIDFLVTHYGVRQIDILDDNFMMKKDRVEAILDGLIKRDYGLSFNLQSGIRSEQVDEKILFKMKKVGFYKLGFGVESADPVVLKIVKKKLDLNHLFEVAQMAKKIGFEVYGFFIIGLPGETEESYNRTIEFARKVDFDIANFTMAIPFVGTELFKMVENSGTFFVDTTKNINEGFYAGKVFYEYGDMKKEDVLRRYKMAYKEFYTLKKRLKLLFRIRSLDELSWFWDSAKFVLKGIFSK